MGPRLFIRNKQNYNMAAIQKYGITYPFTSDNNDKLYLDMNETYADGVKSQLLHVIFTPKGQKLRNPDFGTNLTNYIFAPSDSQTFESLKREISSQVLKYVPSIEFRDISIYKEENDNHGIVVMIEYGVKKGNTTEITTVAVKL
jgi:phage baseplate assembly protein W